MRDLVLVWTVRAEGTVPFAEGFAVWAVGVESEAVFASEEVCEGEVVALEGEGGGRGFWRGRGAGDCCGHCVKNETTISRGWVQAIASALGCKASRMR